jgi:hypothetical protein
MSGEAAYLRYRTCFFRGGPIDEAKSVSKVEFQSTFRFVKNVNDQPCVATYEFSHGENDDLIYVFAGETFLPPLEQR